MSTARVVTLLASCLALVACDRSARQAPPDAAATDAAAPAQPAARLRIADGMLDLDGAALVSVAGLDVEERGRRIPALHQALAPRAKLAEGQDHQRAEATAPRLTAPPDTSMIVLTSVMQTVAQAGFPVVAVDVGGASVLLHPVVAVVSNESMGLEPGEREVAVLVEQAHIDVGVRPRVDPRSIQPAPLGEEQVVDLPDPPGDAVDRSHAPLEEAIAARLHATKSIRRVVVHAVGEHDLRVVWPVLRAASAAATAAGHVHVHLAAH